MFSITYPQHTLPSYTQLSSNIKLCRYIQVEQFFLYLPGYTLCIQNCIYKLNSIYTSTTNTDSCISDLVYPETLSWQGYFNSRFIFRILYTNNLLYYLLNVVLVSGITKLLSQFNQIVNKIVKVYFVFVKKRS